MHTKTGEVAVCAHSCGMGRAHSLLQEEEIAEWSPRGRTRMALFLTVDPGVTMGHGRGGALLLLAKPALFFNRKHYEYVLL